MPSKRGLKKLLFAAALLFLTAAVLLLLLPYWMGLPLRLAARPAGLSYDLYERDGYGRFALSSVGFTNRQVAFSAHRLEAPSPLPWLFQRGAARTNDSPVLRLSGWSLVYTPAGKGGKSIYTNVQEVLAVVKAVQSQIPAALLTDGTAVVSQVAVRIPKLEWQAGNVSLEVAHEPTAHHAMATANLGAHPIPLRVSSDSLGIEMDWRLRIDDSGLELGGPVTWLTNVVETQAVFNREANLPATAFIRARSLSIPAALLGADGYSPISGDAQLTWETNSYAVSLRGAGQPAEVGSRLPPLQVELSATGDLESALVETAVLSSPSLEFKLDSPVRLQYVAPFLNEPAEATFAGDLSKQTWIKLRGKVAGEARLNPGTNNYPSASFRLTSAGAGVPALQTESLTVTGAIAYPQLEIGSMEAALPGGGRASGRGRVDLRRQTILNSELAFSGAPPPGLLPSGLGLENAIVTVTASGPFTNLAHAGSLTLTNLTMPDLIPLSLEGTWTGTHVHRATWTAAVASSNAVLRAAGELLLTGKAAIEVRLDRFSATQHETPLLEQNGPIQLAFGTGGDEHPTMLLQGLNLAGPAGELRGSARINWPRDGELSVRAERLASTLVSGFLITPPPAFEIQSMDARLGWTNGPASGQIILNASTVLDTNEPISRLPVLREPIALRLHAEATESAFRVRDAALAGPAGPIAALSAELPVTIEPGNGKELVRWRPSGRFEGSFFAEPNSVLWEELAKRTGVRITRPELSAKIAGTPEAPRGLVSFRCPELRMLTATNTPSVTDLVVEAAVDGQGAALEQVEFKVDGQQIHLSARLPWDHDLPAQIESGRLPAWTNASGRLQIPEAQLAAAAGSFPAFLRPEGTLKADIQLAPGGNLGGTLVIEGAQLKPLPSIGRIGDIEVRVKFTQQTATIEHARASLSGAEVNLAGEADLTPGEWLRELIPPMVVRVRGTNVPLSRTPDLILRSDLDLVVRRTNGAPPLIVGNANLRNSYILSDLGRMVGGKLATPRQRAPYFSIDDPLLADWRLDLRVTGDKFLKLRTPIFNGLASADMRLGGTLKEPVAIGDGIIDSGFVRFPFATLRIVQGRATLTSQNPYEPQLTISAASRQFGYDIRMEATGPASAPLLQFSSSPPPQFGAHRAVDHRRTTPRGRAGRFDAATGPGFWAVPRAGCFVQTRNRRRRRATSDHSVG